MAEICLNTYFSNTHQKCRAHRWYKLPGAQPQLPGITDKHTHHLEIAPLFTLRRVAVSKDCLTAYVVDKDADPDPLTLRFYYVIHSPDNASHVYNSKRFEISKDIYCFYIGVIRSVTIFGET